MAEEDEIDVLGDFSTDCLDMLPKTESAMYDNSSLMSGSEILNLNDYTIHPQWLLDKPSTNPACWYNTGLEFGLNFEQSTPATNEVTTESITDESGWTEKEKDLIKRGIEIFGKSHVRLSQFVGSRTPAEVRYFLKNFYSYIEKPNIQNDVVFESCLEETVVTSDAMSSNINYSEVLDDIDIPASIEEVIAAVSTAKPTVPVNKIRVRKKSSLCEESSSERNYDNIPSGQSLLKSNYSQNAHQSKSGKNSKFVNKKSMQNLKKSIKNSTEKQQKSSKVKFKANVVMSSNIRRARFDKKPQQHHKTEKANSESKIYIKEHEIVTGTGLSVPVCDGEQVVKIQKECSSSESDVDVEDIGDEKPTISASSPIKLKDENNKNKTVVANEIKKESKPAPEVEIKKEEIETDNNSSNAVNNSSAKSNGSSSSSNSIISQKKRPDLSNVDPKLVELLMSTDIPSSEVTLTNNISDLEKYIHFEFFEGRPTKTPERYLKIRNHIINNWLSNKPAYVTKTSVRSGLKQCGDVNCIGRIHSYLEQIGAINFGCPQTNYVRPLYDLIVSTNLPKEKNTSKDNENDIIKQKLDIFNTRPRCKKKYVKDGEGGCTFLHDERGDVINTTIVNEEPLIKRTYAKKPNIRLIYCRSFSEENPQKFSVHIDLSVLLLMDLHAHMSLSEVMGIVGGIWDNDTKKLHISQYEPCRNVAPSSTHCDMCPITQAQATEKIHNNGFAVLGWFHSHPTFAPEPSQQDIDTQLSVQQWIGSNYPCVGIILSPFSGHGALIASPFRCLIVDKKENFEDQFVPYKFKVNLISHNLDVDNFLALVKGVVNCELIANENKVDFHKKYFQDLSITFLEKFITSLKMHLAKCSSVNKMTCDAIIQGIYKICYKSDKEL